MIPRKNQLLKNTEMMKKLFSLIETDIILLSSGQSSVFSQTQLMEMSGCTVGHSIGKDTNPYRCIHVN